MCAQSQILPKEQYCQERRSNELPKALLALLSGDGRRDVVVVQLLEAFVDESGTHHGAPILSVGVCVGSHKQWRNFLALWRVADFHAKERSSDSLKPILLQAITKSRVRCFVGFVEPKDYATNAGVRLKAGLGNAYVAGVVSCVAAICRNAKRPISFTIEDGQPNSEWVRKVVQGMAYMPEWRDCIAGVALVPKKNFTQLHVADFLAHAWSTRDIWYSRSRRKRGYKRFL
jgi:hypothetical protein